MWCVQTVHQARIEQANGSGRAGVEERVLPDHKASLQAKDAELQVNCFCRLKDADGWKVDEL